ncbi:MAG: T9SS type A sorting domain-containing protein, partial [Candidatus Zixiibacteriota bacterium]
LTTQYNKDIITVSSEAVSDIGAALLVYDIDEKLNVGEPHLVTGVNNMSLGYAFVEGQLRILIYNFGKNKISSGHNDLIEIPYTGEGTLTLSSTEFVDYFGQPYNVVSKENHLPKGFSLSQNYPNPFNPSTTIDFAMPVASEWTLTIYNINGHLVKQFEGYDEAGTMSILWDGTNTSHSRVASGLYLYRLDAESFSKTKKMILIK